MTLTRDDVIKAIEHIQYFYKLKCEIRYAQTRHEDDSTESVAEHIWGMHVVATYFLPLEDPGGKWDRARIMEMITWHDIDEVETGDTIGYLKTAADRAKESEAAKRVMANAPEHIRSHITSLLEEYNALKTVEAKFVKAIDKIEPTIHLFNEKGKRTLQANKTTRANHVGLRAPYVKDFPVIKQFNEITIDLFTEAGFYRPEL